MSEVIFDAVYDDRLEKNERVEGEESPVALILCAEKSQETIELMQLDHGTSTWDSI